MFKYDHAILTINFIVDIVNVFFQRTKENWKVENIYTVVF